MSPEVPVPLARRVCALPRRALLGAALAALGLPIASCHCGGAPDGAIISCQEDLGLPSSVSTDILFVIDNSGSLRQKQAKVVAQLKTFVATLASGPVKNDFQIGVVTTGVTKNVQECNGGPPSLTTYEAESGRLQSAKDSNTGLVSADSPEKILRSADPGLVAKAEKLVTQGTFGSGQEMGLLAAKLAISEPLASASLEPSPGSPAALTGNAGFLRRASRLLIIVVSDEDDCSDPTGTAVSVQGACGPWCTTDAECAGGEGHYCLYDSAFGRRSCTANACETQDGRARLAPVSELVQFFQNLDDGTGRKREVFLAVIGAVDEALNPARCTGNGDEAYGVATRYKEAVTSMGSDHALIESICASDYGPALTRIAQLVSAPQRFSLEDSPADGHLLLVDITRASGEVLRCAYGTGFDFDPPTDSRKGSITLRGDCLLRNGDAINVKLVCAG
jgi:hypothetical protein